MLRLPGSSILLEVGQKHMYRYKRYRHEYKMFDFTLLYQSVQIIKYLCSVYTKNKQTKIP